MADTDLEEIRRARLQQLRQQQGSGGGGSSEGDASAQEQQQQREAEARASILAQILEPAALDRLGRIRLVKASRADDVEQRLLVLARSGQLRRKVTEEELKDMLGQLAELTERKREVVTVQRRKGGWDEDDLDDLLGD